VSRLGLVVPKRICRSAARRNWIKRMVRESFRRAVPADIPLDCVVRLRRDLAPAQAVAARCELGNHWRKVVAR
jgi:ribonuclease P protein component